MSIYNRHDFPSQRRGMTLEALKQQRHSLNMRLLLAMQNHDIETQNDLEKQLKELGEQIDCLQSGGK